MRNNNNIIDRYLILKLNENTLTHIPNKISNTPPLFDPNISSDQLQELAVIKLTGDMFVLKTLEDFLFNKSEEFKI